MVTILSPGSISHESALRSVVLPDPVPPATAIPFRVLTAQRSSCAYHSGSEPSSTSVSSDVMRLENRLIVTTGPPMATGSATAFTRSPLARRAVTMGQLLSSLRPRGASIRSITIMICSGESNTAGAEKTSPLRS